MFPVVHKHVLYTRGKPAFSFQRQENKIAIELKYVRLNGYGGKHFNGGMG